MRVRWQQKAIHIQCISNFAWSLRKSGIIRRFKMGDVPEKETLDQVESPFPGDRLAESSDGTREELHANSFRITADGGDPTPSELEGAVAKENTEPRTKDHNLVWSLRIRVNPWLLIMLSRSLGMGLMPLLTLQTGLSRESGLQLGWSR